MMIELFWFAMAITFGCASTALLIFVLLVAFNDWLELRRVLTQNELDEEEVGEDAAQIS